MTGAGVLLVMVREADDMLTAADPGSPSFDFTGAEHRAELWCALHHSARVLRLVADLLAAVDGAGAR